MPSIYHRQVIRGNNTWAGDDEYVVVVVSGSELQEWKWLLQID